MRERRLQVVPVVWLTLVWVLLWGTFSWGNVLVGLVLGSFVLLVFPLPRLIVGVRVRPIPLLHLAARFGHDLVRASIQVAWQAVRPGPVVSGTVVDIMLRSREELFQTVTAEMVALVPGTVVIDLDGPTGRLTLHALDVHTEQEIEATRQDVYALERRVLRALAADPRTSEPDRTAEVGAP